MKINSNVESTDCRVIFFNHNYVLTILTYLELKCIIIGLDAHDILLSSCCFWRSLVWPTIGLCFFQDLGSVFLKQPFNFQLQIGKMAVDCCVGGTGLTYGHGPAIRSFVTFLVEFSNHVKIIKSFVIKKCQNENKMNT